MGHIHREDGQYDATVSAFILREKPERVLLHRHKLLGIWLQPGGHVELHEHPWQAIAHELEEETGYELSQLAVLQPPLHIEGLVETTHPVPLLYRSHEFPTGAERHFHTDASFAFTTDEWPAHEVGRGESQELRWFTASELEALSPEEIISDTRTIALALLKGLPKYSAVPATTFAL